MLRHASSYALLLLFTGAAQVVGAAPVAIGASFGLVREPDSESVVAADEDESAKESRAEDGDEGTAEQKPSGGDAKNSGDDRSTTDKPSKSVKSTSKRTTRTHDEDSQRVRQSSAKDDKSEAKGDAGDEKHSSTAKDDKPQAKKPAIHVVKTKRLKIDAETDGVFVTLESEEVALRPEAWSSFKVVEAVPHGARVRKGDVLIEFDDRDIKETLEEKSLQQRLAEIALMEAEEELPRLEKSTTLELEIAQRRYDQSVDEYERFKETMRALSEEYSRYDLKSAEKQLENAEEELDQLEKMYTADELTEETEEIVLEQHKFRVEIAKFWVKYGKINHDYTMKISLPQRDQNLKDAVEEAKIALDRAKMAKSLGLSEKRYQVEALRERRARDVERHAKLVEDRALMTLRAPCDGVVYYGRCVKGRWSEVGAYETKLIPHAPVQPNTVLMSVVSERPLAIETSIGEKEVTKVKAEQKAVIVPASDSDVELTAKVDKVDSIPGSGNLFKVSLELDSDELPVWVKPGMTAKVKITTYQKQDAVVIPADLVQTDAEDEKVRYVMVEIEKGEQPLRRDVKLGKKQGKEVEVVDGLEKGDRIVKGAKDEFQDDEEEE